MKEPHTFTMAHDPVRRERPQLDPPPTNATSAEAWDWYDKQIDKVNEHYGPTRVTVKRGNPFPGSANWWREHLPTKPAWWDRVFATPFHAEKRDG